MSAAINEMPALGPMPVRPACYPAGEWNGMMYGSMSSGCLIYLDGKETKINAVDANEILNYQFALKMYKLQKMKIKNYN